MYRERFIFSTPPLAVVSPTVDSQTLEEVKRSTTFNYTKFIDELHIGEKEASDSLVQFARLHTEFNTKKLAQKIIEKLSDGESPSKLIRVSLIVEIEIGGFKKIL